MKLACSQSELKKALSIVNKAIVGKPTIPILSSVLVEASKDKLRLTGYNGELGIVTEIEAKVIEEGVFCTNAAFFTSIINKMPNDIIKLVTAKNKSNILCKGVKLQINIEGPEQYPVFDVLDNEPIVMVQYSEFTKLIKHTYHCVCTDETKKNVLGELFKITNNGIKTYAINGKKLVRSVFKFLSDEEFSYEFRILANALNSIESILQILKEDVYITLDEKNVMFIAGSTQIIARQAEGNFIDCEKYVPKEYNTTVNINRESLIEVLDRVELVATYEKNNYATMAVRENAILLASTTELGSIQEAIPGEVDGKEIVLAINSRFLLESLKTINFNSIDIKFTSPTSPFVITSDEDSEYLYLQLPINV